MAVDMFINFKSTFQGGARDQTRDKEIQIWGFTFGARRPTDVATRAASGRTMVTDVTFTKSADISSPNLFGACLNNITFSEVILTVRKAGEKPLEYIKIVLNNVVIRTFDIEAGEAVGGSTTASLNEHEKITLTFEKIGFTFVDQTASGQAGISNSCQWSWNTA